MENQKISNSIRKTIKSAFAQIGYSDAMISSDVHFAGEAGNPFFADLVAYAGSLRKDTDTAVISVKGIDNTDEVKHDKDIVPFLALATPIIILAEYKKAPDTNGPRLLITGLNKVDTGTKGRSRDNVIPLSRFKEYLKAHQEQFTPRRLERAKWHAEQLTLFDVYPNLIEEAYQIAINELVHRFERGVRNILEKNPQEYKRSIIQASIAILAARILRDRLRAQWPTSSGVIHFLEYAKAFLPGYFDISPGIAKRLDPLLSMDLNDTLDFSQVSIDIVGKFYESAFVTKETRDQWGIHYTPSLLAKTLLRRMPIEEIPPSKRILADPTCGSGSLLAAGYERLADATYLRLSDDERHQKLISSIYGNDKDGFATQVARMTLMLFHPPHKNNWKVTELDAEADSFKDKWLNKLGVTPTIIVANPPFGEKGGGTKHPGVQRARNQIDRAGLILERCLDILPDGGLLGIILPETILDQQLVKPIRNRIVQECEILEQWSIPPAKWFEKVNRPVMAWVIRKQAPTSKFVHILPLSDVPVPNLNVKPRGTINIDTQALSNNLVPSLFDELLTKIEKSPNRIGNFYPIHSGLQAIKGNIKNNKNINAYPWSGTDARGTDPFSDFSEGRKGWIELKDSNFHPKGPRRKLREHLILNDPIVMLRANRNVPLTNYKWSSIALIDVPHDNRKIVAPSENFLVAFSKEKSIECKQNYIYALWAILNHPIASLWLHERFVVTKITTDNFKNFPLPIKWTDTKNVKLLASLARKLLLKVRASQKAVLEIPDTKSSAIESLVNDIDDVIFQMYGLTKVDRQHIEEWFDREPRPGLEDYCESKKSDKDSSSVINIVYEEPIWDTTFETLDIDFERSLIKFVIDGLTDNHDKVGSDKNGIWLKVIPAMPGWCMRKGVAGWIELTTHSQNKLKRAPEKYIANFRLYKNAYKTQKEIDKSLHMISDIKRKKVVS